MKINTSNPTWIILKKTNKSLMNGKDIIKQLLDNRGLKSNIQKQEFLHSIHPGEIKTKDLGIDSKELKKAVKRVNQARKNKEHIIIYGDYDADGICGTAILWEYLYTSGYQVLPYLPERFSEGYGLNAASIKSLKKKDEKLKLIISVDNGIVAHDAVAHAKDLGIDTIITDHHEEGEKYPNAYSIVHTKKIGGSALAWILARELGNDTNNGLDLAAIGTIADQLPLLYFNRSFAYHGLDALKSTTRPGLKALFTQSFISGKDIDAYKVGFIIAPRLNAMGRLEHAIESLRLLCTKNPSSAFTLSSKLEKVNKKRQDTVEKVVKDAIRKASAKDPKKAIVIANESFHEGVIGLAAARLVEEYYRPAIVVSVGKKISKASARSISGFNIIKAIRKFQKLLEDGGGHTMAAGFSIKNENLKNFTEKFEDYSKKLLTKEVLTRKLKIDLPLELGQINETLAYQLGSFEPTGMGNPRPVFLTQNVCILDERIVGSNGGHLKLKVEKDGISKEAIAFGKGSLLKTIKPNIRYDIAYNIEINEWNGYKNAELHIKDIRTNHKKSPPS